MKQLQDIDFRAAYGPVPDGFSRSVQQALHQTKEEPMKKFTLRTAVMAVVTSTQPLSPRPSRNFSL